MTATIDLDLDQSHLSDDELMARINAGDVEACLAELRARYGRRIHALVLGIVRDSHLADDVSAEVFAKVFRKSHLYRADTNFAAWLLEVARNQALSALRARRRLPVPISGLGGGTDANADVDLLDGIAAHGADDAAEEQDLMAAFERAVDELPQSHREPFTLCAQQGLQYRQAAALLGIPTGTVAIRIMRARKRLYKALAHHFERLRRPPSCFVN